MLFDDARMAPATGTEQTWETSAGEKHQLVGLEKGTISQEDVSDPEGCTWAGPPHGLLFALEALCPVEASNAHPAGAKGCELVLLRR